MSHELLNVIDAHYSNKFASEMQLKDNQIIEIVRTNGEQARTIAQLNASNSRLIDEKEALETHLGISERSVEHLKQQVGSLSLNAPVEVEGHDVTHWHQAAVNWQGRAAEQLARNGVLGKKCYMHEEEIARLKSAASGDALNAALAANGKLREIQAGLNRKITEQKDEIAQLKQELELTQQAHKKLQAAMPTTSADAIQSQARLNAYQIRNGVVLSGNELAENNRDAH